MTSARWETGGLTLNFQGGAFRGWVVSQNGMPVGEIGLAVGAPPPDVALDETSLGREFSAGGVFGLVDESDKIALLWAGTTCFFR